MTDTHTSEYRDDIVFFGSRVDAGDIDRETAVDQLVEVSARRIKARDARQAIDTWQGYLTTPSFPTARRALLSRLFTRRTTNTKGTTRR